MAQKFFHGLMFGGLALSAGLALATADTARLFPVEYAEGPYEIVSAKEAAEEISEATKPSIILLYSPTDHRSQKMFPQFVTLAREFEHRGVEMFAYSVSPKGQAGKAYGFIRKHKAPFDPTWIQSADKDSLRRALSPLGISLPEVFKTPMVIVRDAEGTVVLQKESVTGMAGLRERMLAAGLARND